MVDILYEVYRTTNRYEVYRIMKYIGLLIDPKCFEPVLQCIGMDINEPLWYPHRSGEVPINTKDYNDWYEST